MAKYKITYQHYPLEDNEVEEIILETDRIDWSIDQYRRNRHPMEIKEVKQL